MDYNIFIRSVEGYAPSNPTIPWNYTDTNPTKPWQQSAQQAESGMNLPVVPSLLSKGASVVGKALPWVILAKYVYEMASTMANNVLPYFANETGDYRLVKERENIKNATSWIFSPFQSIANHHNAEQQIRLEDDRRAQNRLLLGDAVLNNEGGKGV